LANSPEIRAEGLLMPTIPVVDITDTHEHTVTQLTQVRRAGSRSAEIQALHRILREESLHAVFQPILDMHGRKFMAYEALIRGPVDSPLHMPAALFETAQHANLRRELEHACRAAAIRDFAALKLDGKLF